LPQRDGRRDREPRARGVVAITPVHDEVARSASSSAAARRQRDVQGVLLGERALLEHPVMHQGADARERPARGPRRPRIREHRLGGVPALSHAGEIAVVEREPEPRLITTGRLQQLAPRSDAAHPSQDELEPSEPCELVLARRAALLNGIAKGILRVA
jgi:hypothetical protein